jgi:L-fuconolactonase
MNATSSIKSSEPMIDTHHHFWRYPRPGFEWITERMPVLRRDYLPADLNQAAGVAGVEGAISVQARESLDETEDLLRLADGCPLVRGVVGWASLADPRLKEHLDRFCADARLIGMREFIQGRPDAQYFDNPAFHDGLAEVGRRHLVFDLLIYTDQLPAAARCVDRHAEMTFVLDHSAKPPIAKERFPSHWARDIKDLARRPNVWCKISGLVTEVVDPEWDQTLLQPYFDVLLAAFGSERLMFGSDWPVCLLRSSYARWAEMVRAFLLPLSPAERERISRRNAAKAYGLKL